MSKQQFTFEVFADYHQFYVQDGGINPEAPTDWTDEDVERRAKVADKWAWFRRTPVVAPSLVILLKQSGKYSEKRHAA